MPDSPLVSGRVASKPHSPVAWAVFLNIVFMIGMIPETRQWFRIRRENKWNDTTEVMQLSGMGRGLLKMARKLGLSDWRGTDESLVQDLLQLMSGEKADFTLTFRRLADLAAPDPPHPVAALFELPPAFTPWLARWREALKDAGKTVVVSMGDVAASGGYWIAMGADEVWASPSTITGSIGVFGVAPTFSKPLAKLGIHTDGVGTTELAGKMRLDRPSTGHRRRNRCWGGCRQDLSNWYGLR